MTAIRRYIQAPVHFDAENSVVLNKKFIDDLDSLIIDSGLIKSNTVGNLDLSTFNMDAWYTANKDKTGSNFIPVLEYDLSDTQQVNLPVKISIYFGFWFLKTNAPRQPILRIDVTCGVSTVTTCNCIEHYSAADNNIPFRYDDQIDSFITNLDGFFSMNICNGFQMKNRYSGATPASSVFGSVQIERSFNSLGVYTSDDINVFLPLGSVYNEKPMRNVLMTKDETFADTSTTFIYFNKYNTVFQEGKLVFHSMYHVSSDSSIRPSPNMIAVAHAAFRPSQEAKLSINDDVEVNFIALNNGNDSTYQSSILSSHNRYVTQNCRVIVRFE